jgi:uncharacterized membrane protein
MYSQGDKIISGGKQYTVQSPFDLSQLRQGMSRGTLQQSYSPRPLQMSTGIRKGFEAGTSTPIQITNSAAQTGTTADQELAAAQKQSGVIQSDLSAAAQGAQGIQAVNGTDWAGNIIGGAESGASIGTMIAPGVGTAIGSGVGAIGGLLDSWINYDANKKKSQNAANQQNFENQVTSEKLQDQLATSGQQRTQSGITFGEGQQDRAAAQKAQQAFSIGIAKGMSA